jgi:hypothetical protein
MRKYLDMERRGMVKVPEMHEMEVERSHHDVMGKWGGFKAWVVHYKKGAYGRMEIYRHVGAYHEVGNWPGDYGPSKWEVVNRCVEFLHGETSLVALVMVAIGYCLKDWGIVGRVIFNWGDFVKGVKRASAVFSENREKV